MIAQVFLWWLMVSLMGLLALPVLGKVLHRLPDRGYGFSKAVGLLGVGFTVWFGASIGILRNDLGGIIGCTLVLGVLAYFVAAPQFGDWRTWFRKNRRTVLVYELVFLAFYLGWAVVRAYNPEIQATEKPMELGFINAILRSESFPPNDPWLSGYGISYYYFGYVLIAILSRLTGTAAGVAFNLANALWFAFTAIGSYSLIFNLVSIFRQRSSHTLPFLGPLFILLTGNLEGFFEVLWAKQLFWRRLSDGSLQSNFWNWLDIKDLVNPPTGDPAWISSRNWWWWRASRVVRDVNFRMEDIEVIDEFPFFSFLLADNHPHVLALPFALLTVAFALNLFLGGKREPRPVREPGLRVSWSMVLRIVLVGVIATGLVNALRTFDPDQAAMSLLLGFLRGGVITGLVLGVVGFLLLVHLGSIPIYLNSGELWFGAWLFGGLAFLNTWDSPVYFVVFAASLWLVSMSGEIRTWMGPFAGSLAVVVISAVLLYLPWLPTFSSQAGGVLPNLPFPTKPQHFLLMFGTMFVPILWWLAGKHPAGKPLLHMLSGILVSSFAWTGLKASDAVLARALFLPLVVLGIGLAVWALVRILRDPAGNRLLIYTFGLPIGLLLVSWLLAAVVVALGDGYTLDAALAVSGTDDLRVAVNQTLLRRLESVWVPLALGGVVAISFSLVGQVRRDHAEIQIQPRDREQLFIVLLVAVGALLILAPEYLYLRDLFGSRMNTIFKFYYSAWVLWGLAAAVAVIELFPSRFKYPEGLRALLVVPLAMGLIYPFFSLQTKTNRFQSFFGATLDGIAYLEQVNPEDYRAIRWINSQLNQAVIAEAVGGSYSSFARISAHTGLPTVLGWEFHEVQWRGDATTQIGRAADVELLYKTPDWLAAATILDKYQIDYVYIGPLERLAYQPLNEMKFDLFMELIYQSGEVKIYARRN